MEYNPEKIASEVEQKELGEMGEKIEGMSNTELMMFINDNEVCNALAKWVMKKRNIDISEHFND